MYPSLLAALLYAFAASKASRYSGLTGAELSQNQQAPYGIFSYVPFLFKVIWSIGMMCAA